MDANEMDQLADKIAERLGRGNAVHYQQGIPTAIGNFTPAEQVQQGTPNAQNNPRSAPQSVPSSPQAQQGTPARVQAGGKTRR